MTKTIWVNGQSVRQRMHQLGLSERDAAEAARMTSTSIRSIVAKNELSKSFGIAQVSRLAATLGITISELFEAPTQPLVDSDDDVRSLIQVLTVQRRGLHPDRLARALGWDLDRLQAAVHGASGQLQGQGLIIHEASSGLILRPAKDMSAIQARIDTLQDNDEGLNQGVARVLFAAHKGTLPPTADRADHQLALGRLHNLGVLTDSRAEGRGRNETTEEFRYCLDF